MRGSSSYQQDSGHAIEQRTRAMIVAEAERIMREVLTGPDGAAVLARLTAADICGRAREYVRRDGSRGPIPKATLWKHFKTVQSVAAAVVEQAAAEQREVPAPVVDLARTTARTETVDAVRLEARLSGRHYDIAELERQFEAAQARGDRADMLYWATESAERLLPQRRRTDTESVHRAREWALRGLDVVDAAVRLDCMLGIRCVRAATAAELVLSRRPEYEATALNRIRSLKETELSLAETLGWPVHAALARFHLERARALGEEDPEREIRSIAAAATTLIALCGTASGRENELQDRLQPADLAGVIVRLCGIELAYARHPRYGAYFRNVFSGSSGSGEDAERRTHDLLRCFPLAPERDRHREDVRALLRLQDLAHRLDLLDPADTGGFVALVENYEQASGDLLRTVDFGATRDILLARYLAAKAKSLELQDDAQVPRRRGAADRSLVQPRTADLIRSAIQFYEHAATATGHRGSTGILRAHAADISRELAQANPGVLTEPDTGQRDSDEFSRIVRSIKDLVLITITRRNRFTDTEIRELMTLVDPVYYYITAGRR